MFRVSLCGYHKHVYRVIDQVKSMHIGHIRSVKQNDFQLGVQEQIIYVFSNISIVSLKKFSRYVLDTFEVVDED